MNDKNKLISYIITFLEKFGNFTFDEVYVDMSGNDGAEVYRAETAFIDDDNIPYVELENGDIVELDELDYNELLDIYDEMGL